MDTEVDVVTAVAMALVNTHANHSWALGTVRSDGFVPLWLDGAGEFQDHYWLIGPDGLLRHDTRSGRGLALSC